MPKGVTFQISIYPTENRLSPAEGREGVQQERVKKGFIIDCLPSVMDCVRPHLKGSGRLNERA